MRNLALAVAVLALGLLGSRALYLQQCVLVAAPDERVRRLGALRALAIGQPVGVVMGIIFGLGMQSTVAGLAFVAVLLLGIVASFHDVDRTGDWLPDYAIGVLAAGFAVQLAASP